MKWSKIFDSHVINVLLHTCLISYRSVSCVTGYIIHCDLKNHEQSFEEVQDYFIWPLKGFFMRFTKIRFLAQKLDF